MRRAAFLLTVVCLTLSSVCLGQRRAPAPAQSSNSLAPSIHVALGAPSPGGTDNDWILTRRQYVTSYNRARSGPNWTSWELSRAWIGGQKRHSGRFITDESLPPGWPRVDDRDYAKVGLDRGHLAPSKDRSVGQADNDSTFLLTNVLPQEHDLNAGPWERLEAYSRVLAQHDGRRLFVSAGGIFPAQPRVLGHGAAVPSSFWKIVVVLGPEQGARDVTATTRVIAVVMPNEAGVMQSSWKSYVVPVSEIERRTGLHFLGRVDPTVAAALKLRTDATR